MSPRLVDSDAARPACSHQWWEVSFVKYTETRCQPRATAGNRRSTCLPSPR